MEYGLIRFLRMLSYLVELRIVIDVLLVCMVIIYFWRNV